MILAVYAFLIIILNTSCSPDSPVNIQYNTQFAGEHKIAIDDTLIIKKDISNNYKTLLLKKGRHSLSIDNGTPKEFNVDEEGGILNIASELSKFVTYGCSTYMYRYGQSKPRSYRLAGAAMHDPNTCD